MTEVFTIKQCLEGEISVDETVTVRGWVKTRRDSKAGLSFISLHDGSCFAPIQIVATDDLTNYHDEVTQINRWMLHDCHRKISRLTRKRPIF